MATVADILAALEAIAPERYAFGFDKIGLQVGDPTRIVTRAVVSLDRSLGAVTHAIATGAEMLISHHPLIFEPAKTVTTRDHVGQTILLLAEHKVAFAAAHTNWDSARGGINDALADTLNLRNVRPFGSAAGVPMLKLVVFTPSESAPKIMQAAWDAGAGEIENYSHCSFASDGVGSFMGNERSHPVVGKSGNLERVPESRTEVILKASQRFAVEQAIRSVHPYEEPAYDFIPLIDQAEQPAGRIGHLPEPMTLAQLVAHVEGTLKTKAWAWGDPSQHVSTFALLGGAADGEWQNARSEGADVYLTGEVRQHVALEASELGMPIIAAGHYATEHPGCEELTVRLRNTLPEITWSCFSPQPGQAGRPLN